MNLIGNALTLRNALDLKGGDRPIRSISGGGGRIFEMADGFTERDIIPTDKCEWYTIGMVLFTYDNNWTFLKRHQKISFSYGFKIFWTDVQNISETIEKFRYAIAFQKKNSLIYYPLRAKIALELGCI